MNSRELFAKLYASGARLRLEGDRVCVSTSRELTEEVLCQLTAYKDEIRDLLYALQNEGKQRKRLERRERPERLPLSYAQQRLWFIDRLEGTSAEYNVPQALRLKGELNQEAVRRVINTMVERHESLRTHFEEVEGEPAQVIETELRIEMPVEDLSGLEPGEQRERVKEELRQESRTAFDLGRGPLLRMKLLKVGRQEHILLRTMHHIVSDGWSQEVFNREFQILYEAFSESRENPLKPLAVQYADFALWQREWLEEGALEQGLSYWKEQLAGIPDQLELPVDRARPAVQTFGAGACRAVLSAEQTEKLKKLSQESQATLYMTLLAAFGVLLARYSGQDDIVVGTPIANRQDAQLEELIGFFINTLVMRMRVRPEMSFRGLLEQVRRTALKAYEHQDVPFERLVEELKPERSLSRTPVYQVVFGLQNAPWEPQRPKGLEVEPVRGDELRVRFDLEVHAFEREGQIGFGWVYNRDLFDGWRMEQMAWQYVRVLEEVIRHADEAVGRLDVLGEEERRRILEEWNDTAHEVPQATLPELFEQQVERTPEAAAVVYEDSRLSYRELNERANRLAHYLIGRGAGPEDVVAIAVPRSLEMMVALLGVLKSGAAYLPLDPDYPAERLRFMLEDAEPVCVVTTRELAASLPYAVDSLILDEPETAAAVAHAEAHNPADAERSLPLLPHHPAYVIYTSGSTGKPKGVVVEHAGIPNLAGASVEWFGVRSDSRILQFASLNYDASSWEVIMALTAGAALVVSEARSGRELRDVMVRQGVSHATLPPAVLTTLEETGELPLANLIVGGEACSGETVARWSEGRRMINAYGPTETTVCATLSTPLRGGEQPPIGKPIWNTRVYVLDRNLEVAPVGVAGELYIAGAGLARGYLKRPGLTAERFVADPYGVAGTRMYRTGDLARWRVDGNLEFLGRVDQQVKIRGFRVETGEIEARLLEYPGIEQAAVVAREDSTGDKRLVAYVVEAAGQRVDRGELREHLGQQLPDYMVPGAYVSLEAMPLTANGKLDRRALPEPGAGTYVSHGYEEPRGELEHQLAGTWAELLGLERVGRNDNFFELGGHSLKIVTLLSRMRQLGLQADARTLFTTPTLAGFAAATGRQQNGIVVVPLNRIPEQCEVITSEMLPLVELSAEEIRQIVGGVPGGAANVQDIYPLAPLQEGILFQHLVDAEADPYLLPLLMSFDSWARLQSYLQALQAVIDRHDILRTGVVWEGLSEPVQVVWRKAPLVVEDLTVAPAARDVTGQMRALAERQYHMDLRQAPLLRGILAYDGIQEQWLLLLWFHHMAIDHTTMEIIGEEIEAYLSGTTDGLPKPLPFRNFVAQARLGVSQEEHEVFFRGLLGDVEEPTAPFGLMDVQGDGRKIRVARHKVEIGLEQRVRERARLLGVSAASLFHVAWAQVLARVSGREDVVFGTVLFGRMQSGYGAERVLGLFINTLPVRIAIGEAGVEESVLRVHSLIGDLLRHEHAPLTLAQRCSGVPAPVPLFSALLNYRYSRVPTRQPSDERMRTMEGIRRLYSQDRNSYPCALAVDDVGEGFYLTAHIQKPLEPKRVCELMQRALEALVEALDSTPSRALSRLDVLGEEERRRILEEWNDTAHEVPQATLPELFEQQVERTPEAAAVVYEDSRLSYRELNERANRLAHYLIGRGAGPEDVVAIAVPRSLEMMVALLGVLKSGAAYLPLDPDYPAERLRFMLEDAEPVCVVTTRELAASLPYAVDSLILDEPETAAAVAHAEAHNPADAERSLPLLPHHPAYVIYTSGSTGKPKGVVVEHAGIPNLAGAQVEWFGVRSDSRILQFASLNYDASSSEVIMALTAGAALVVSEARSGRELRDVMVRQGVSHATLPPAVLTTLEETGELPLANLIVAGEACSGETVARWSEGRRMINAYGPTETTVCATLSTPLRGGEQPPIGKPIWNTRVYVLDRNLEVAPVGVAGELYIAGAGLARGYLKRPGLTAERFVADPYGVAGTRMYRTGDLARWRVDGNLEFLGRVDQQVKIRGFRVETGEIEARLLEYPGIEQAAVVAREDSTGDKRLVAYVVEAAGQRVDRGELREYLGQQLPDYMVPGAYVSLEAMPLTANGKLDRRALPEPEQAGGAGYRAPRTPEEEILCGLFAEVLGLERVGLDDDFFELGGHSLKAVSLASRVRAMLGVELQLDVLFEWPRVSELGPRLRQASGKQRKRLERRERPERLPLSYAQQRLWFIDRLEGTSTEYNVPQALRLKGELNQEAVQRAINTMVERHESLRTHFEEVEGEPAQVIETELRIEMPVEDLSGLEPGEQRERVKEELRQESRTAFDLGRGPLLRMKLLKVGRQEHILLRTMHHIVSDGWSQGVFNREFQILYEAFSESRENPLKPLAVQYADFALWQREWLEEGALEQGLSYWKEQLAGIPDQLELPADRARPAVQTFGAGVCQAVLSAEQTEKLKKLSQESQATLYMTLLAAFGVLLARYSGQDDIVVGTPIANRQDAQLEELIGFFINTLVMRMRVRPEMSFRGLLEQVRRTALKAYEHQDVPFERLVEELKPERSLSRTPVYQVVFGLQNAPWEPQRPKGLEVEPVRGDELRGHFDLTVHAFEREGRIGFGWVYNRDLFDGWRMEQMARQYVRVLEEVIRHADEAVGQLDVLGEEERRRILEEWNDTAHEVPQATLPELFEQQVERTPEAAAVVYEDSRLSYRELNERANRLAHYLIGRGAGPEDVVAIAVPRSLEMMVALLGVLKSGAAYLPLDPDYPAERLRFMLEDAEPVCVVTTRELAASLPYAVDSLILDEPETAAAVAHAEAHNPADAERSLPLLPHHPAYVIYTSGSTGKPKGVVVEHRQICNYVDGVNERVRFPLPAKFALLQSLAFDFSATVLFTALCKGGLLHVISEQASTDAVVLGEYFEKEEIESVKIAPSHLAALQSSPGWERVVPRQRLIFGGEASRRDWVEAIQAIRPGCVIFNHYGPTETTVGVLMYQLESGADTNTAMVPLGRPLSNLKAYVLDRNLEVAPVGVAGELYIAGAGLARGYLKRPGLTAERFVADPYGVAGTRMYRTGDLARWRVDGNLEFLGRVDQQVKIRGFRVETGEIEARLLEYPGIEQAAVVAREDSTGDKRLVAYVVEAAGQRVDRGELREYLGQQLPDYMVPGAYVSLEAMPLTANGKLDRRALPEPEQAGGAGYRAPRTPEEEILCGLFAEVLGLERVGLDDDFFELGGHSLKAVSLASRVRAMLGVELQLDVLFEWPRVSELGPRLRQASGKQRKRLERRERPERLPLSYAQQRLWFIDRLEGTSTEYNVPQALRLKGELNQEAVQRAINTMVERHESLRTHFEEVEGEPAQVIETELRIEMPVEDLSGLEPGEQRERVKEELRQESRTAFDLGRGPLLRMKLLKVGRQEHILLRTMHHIVSDGWSQGVFNREFQILYEAFSESRENPLKPLAVQYADFALWQREWLEEGALEQGLSYWKEQLAGIPDQLELPADRARPAVQTFGAGVCQAVLSAEQTEKLKKLSQESQATLYMTLLAAFGVLLARYSGQDDIVVGTPIANRQDAQLEELIGFFINTLVMRMRVRPEMSFRGLLEQVRQTALKAYEHQDVPFERLVEELKPERSLSRTPVYQVVFGLQNAPWEPRRPKGLEVEPVRGDELRVRFDLEVHAFEREGRIGFGWVYNRDLFDGWRMEQMARQYVRVLQEVIR